MCSKRILVQALLAPMLVACAADPDLRLESALVRIDVLENQNAKLEQRVASLERGRQNLDKVLGVVESQRIDAEVLEVTSELKLVVVNKGRLDGVQVGTTFLVYLGSQYKGQVLIQAVHETTSSGLILSEKKSISVGDSATTSL